MEDCGICIHPINRDRLRTCIYCKFRICCDCLINGVKLDKVSTYNVRFKYYCSTNCFYSTMLSSPHYEWTTAISNNFYKDYTYVQLIRTHQEKCWKTIQTSHISKLVYPYVSVIDLGTLICEYLL